jgi:hypothetical protein
VLLKGDVRPCYYSKPAIYMRQLHAQGHMHRCYAALGMQHLPAFSVALPDGHMHPCDAANHLDAAPPPRRRPPTRPVAARRATLSRRGVRARCMHPCHATLSRRGLEPSAAYALKEPSAAYALKEPSAAYALKEPSAAYAPCHGVAGA